MVWKANHDFEILTPSGFRSFDGIQKTEKRTLEIITTAASIGCSLNHMLLLQDGTLIAASDICIGDTLFPDEKVIAINDGGTQEVYDPLNVDDGNLYTSGVFVSHNCAFLGSSATLISAAKLLTLSSQDPIKQTDNTRVYADPAPDHIYACTVDVAEGLGGDASVVMVFDITTIPYRPVYIYQDRYIDTMALPALVAEVGRRYNKAMVLVESNFGQLVGDILWREHEYENVIFTQRAIKIPGGFKIGWGGKQQRPGVQMNALSKRVGCSNLKSLIENDQLIIRDGPTIEELRRFAVKGKSYAAESGNDDLVMSLVLFGWLSDQGYVRAQNSGDVRKEIAKRNQQRIDDNMLVSYSSNMNQPDAPIAVSSKNDDWLLKDNDPVIDPYIEDNLSRWDKW